MEAMNSDPADEEYRPDAARRIYGAMIAAVLALVGIAAAVMMQYDANERVAAQDQVGDAMAHDIAYRAEEASPQGSLDLAVTYLANSLNTAYADRYLAIYGKALHDMTRIVVVDGSDRPIYAAVDGKRAGLAAADPMAPVLAQILPPMRAEALRRPPFQLKADYATLITRPIQQTGFAMIGGKPHLVIATLVQPDFGTALPKADRTPVVVGAVPIDADFADAFSRRYKVPGLAFASTIPVRDGVERIELTGFDGKPVGYLTWPDPHPATWLMIRLLPPVLGVLALVGLLVAGFVSRTRSMAGNLIVSEARARHLAYHDTLTQLPNRAMMFDRLHIALANARRHGGGLAVHCLDLDRFKAVNDTLGHQAGDELIRKVAAMLTGLCRETDTVARLGGDEFVIIQPNTDASGARLLGERVLKAIKEPVELEFGIVEVGVSIGVAMSMGGEGEPGELMRHADLALYDAKENGRNRVAFFEPEMDAAIQMRRELETDLRAALTSGALTMVYQPQIDHTGEISGMEALVRWNHPVRGAIAPSVFIPLAEESGLILELGEFVLQRVFDETRDWGGTHVAINVSALQLRSPLFMSTVTRLVAEYRVDPSRYEIEITETALLGDDGVTRNNIIMLKQEGFSIALDDFGTGYSSLSTLQRFAVDKIKIDRSFVRTLEADGEADALIEAIIKLGRALKLNIVAEGVETEGQREKLLSAGCNHFQGYLLSRPMKANAAQDMLAA